MDYLALTIGALLLSILYVMLGTFVDKEAIDELARVLLEMRGGKCSTESKAKIHRGRKPEVMYEKQSETGDLNAIPKSDIDIQVGTQKDLQNNSATANPSTTVESERVTNAAAQSSTTDGCSGRDDTILALVCTQEKSTWRMVAGNDDQESKKQPSVERSIVIISNIVSIEQSDVEVHSIAEVGNSCSRIPTDPEMVSCQSNMIIKPTSCTRCSLFKKNGVTARIEIAKWEDEAYPFSLWAEKGQLA